MIRCVTTWDCRGDGDDGGDGYAEWAQELSWDWR
jgi:hypothetical protein